MNKSQMQRPLNSASNATKPMVSLNVGTLPAAPIRSRIEGEGIARDGAEKITPAAPVKPGMARRTTGEMSPHIHSQTVNDEPNVPFKSYEKIPVHPGMTAKQRAAIDPYANDPAEILANASRLGRKA